VVLISIDEINNNMAFMWPDVYSRLKKSVNNEHMAILNLLANGHSVLFISDNRPDRTKLFNLFDKLDISHLIIDFEFDIKDDSFLTYLIEDSNVDFSDDIDELFEKKKNIEKIINILSDYSYFNLTPYETKEMRDYHFNKLNNKRLIFPISNLDQYNKSSIDNIARDIEDIVNELDYIFFLKDYFSRDFFESEEYNILMDVSNNFKDNLNDLIKLNKKLNILTGLKIFNNLLEMDYLENIPVLSKNPKYIEKMDRNILNEDLRFYFNSDNLNKKNIPQESPIHKYVSEGEDIIEKLLISVLYTELIDNDILTYFNMGDNKEFVLNKFKILLNIHKYCKKQLFMLSSFYKKYECFKLSSTDFDLSNSYDGLFKSFDIYLEDFNKLKRYNKFLNYNFDDENLKDYVELVFSNKVGKNDIINVFYFNFYDALLNIFLEKYDFNESKLNVAYYKKELTEINSKIGDDCEKQFFRSIEFHISQLNNDKNVLKEKEQLNSILDDVQNKFENFEGNYEEIEKFNIKILREYKEFIFANRRLFLIDEKMLSLLSSINYIQEFDYVIRNNKIEYMKK